MDERKTLAVQHRSRTIGEQRGGGVERGEGSGTGTALPEPWMSVLIIVMSFATRTDGPRSRIEQGPLRIEVEGR